MQPPYQPSANKPADGGDPALADPANPTTLPPQTDKTIGDLLSAKGIGWAWYAGAWQATLDGKNAIAGAGLPISSSAVQLFRRHGAGHRARAEHLRDGGLDGAAFIKAIDAGTLPQVTFYKPQGNLNEHAGYAAVLAGDQHIADVIAHLEKSPQWAHMLVVVTYDENGGFWDHVAPPKGDRWGPGSRIPTHHRLAVRQARLCRSHAVRHDLDPALHHQALRTAGAAGAGRAATALKAHGSKPMGDLTAALTLTSH